MELHGIEPRSGRKEITCRDCGHRFLIAQGQPSAACQVCGNIMFVGTAQASVQPAAELSQMLAKRVLPRLEETGLAPDPLAAFRVAPSGAAVEEIRMRYQVEWQLWAALLKKFHDPAHHFAYLTQAIMLGELEKAAARYREHRSVMATLSDSRWQSEISDLMLARVETIALSRLEAEKARFGTAWGEWIQLVPWQSRVVRVGWVAFGVGITLRLFVHYFLARP